MLIKEKLQYYCNSITKYSRYKTREVFIGDIPLGADNPIRIQSMTMVDSRYLKDIGNLKFVCFLKERFPI